MLSLYSWSFATVIWEIATYGELNYYGLLLVLYFIRHFFLLVGAKPFTDFTIGASVEPFVQHLKDGNRLPQPDGLSGSM